MLVAVYKSEECNYVLPVLYLIHVFRIGGARDVQRNIYLNFVNCLHWQTVDRNVFKNNNTKHSLVEVTTNGVIAPANLHHPTSKD